MGENTVTMSLWPLLFIALSYVVFAQDIATVLSQQVGISQFTDIVLQNPDIVDLLNSGAHTGPWQLYVSKAY